MARRIDIELTSTRPDGSWTWRAAGAKEPRGLVEGSLLYEGAKPGDVVKAEAEFEIDGITIISIAPPKADNRPEPQRIELISSSRGDSPGVTTQLVGRTTRRREGPDGRSGRDGRGGREGRDGRDGRPPRERPPRERTDRDQAGANAGRPPRPRRERPRDEAGAGGQNGTTDETQQRQRPRREGGAGRTVRPGPGRPSGDESAAAADRKSKRLNPGHAHRQAMLESLPPEQRPIAEQVLRGGIPAVRTALHLEREKAAAEGRPTPNTDQLVAMAEELLPRLKSAEWRDRAEAAAKDADVISLRDLRSVVAGSDVARDDETRALAATLREALEKRVAGLHDQWVQEIVKHLDENRVVRALRLSARPPEPLARLDADLSQRLSDATSQAMAPDTPPDRWLALLDAGAASPVRRSIRPVGLPADPDPEVKKAAYQQSGRIPALATMLGVSIPPPPTPSASRTRRPASPRKPAGPARAPRKPDDPSKTERPSESSGSSITDTPANAPADAPAPTEARQEPTTPEPTESVEPTIAPETTDSPQPASSPEPTESVEATVAPELDASAERGQDPPVVEELGEPVDEPKIGDLG